MRIKRGEVRLSDAGPIVGVAYPIDRSVELKECKSVKELADQDPSEPRIHGRNRLTVELLRIDKIVPLANRYGDCVVGGGGGSGPILWAGLGMESEVDAGNPLQPLHP